MKNPLQRNFLNFYFITTYQGGSNEARIITTAVVST